MIKMMIIQVLLKIQEKKEEEHNKKKNIRIIKNILMNNNKKFKEYKIHSFQITQRILTNTVHLINKIYNLTIKLFKISLKRSLMIAKIRLITKRNKAKV